MSARGRGIMISGSRGRGVNKPGNSSNPKPHNEQRNSQGGVGRQVSSPENHEASGTQPQRFGLEAENNSGKSNVSNHNRRPGNLQQGMPQVRAFGMNKQYDQKSSADDETKQASHRTTQSPECTVRKSDGNSSQAEKLSDSFGSQSHNVEHKLPDPNKSRQIFVEVRENIIAEYSKEQTSDSSDANMLHKRGKKPKAKSCVTEIEGDLFNAPENISLAHCVGADLRMGSGIAVKFREQFKSIGRLFDQRVGPGGVAFIRSGQRCVFYLVTKQASQGKPTIDTMRKSLIALSEKCKELHVTKLAMPQIGCGKDGLLWSEVKQMLEEIFADLCEITVYKFDGECVDTPKQGFKSQVKNENMLLRDIETGTGLLYIGSKKLNVTQEMKSLNEKYPFLRRLNTTPVPPKLGSALYTKIHKPDSIVFGLICRESEDSPLSYEHLETAIRHLKEHQKRNRLEYFGLQAFEEKDDPYVMEKIDTLFRNSLIDAEFWICWPPSLVHHRQSYEEQAVESMEDQQSGSRDSPNSTKETKERKSNNSSPKGESRWEETQNKPDNRHQNIREVEDKMNVHSLTDESKSEMPKVDPNYPEATNDVLNTNKMEWDDSNDSVEIPEHVDGSKSNNDEGWWDGEEPRNYAEDEKRKTKEKQQAIQENKEKERRDRNNVRPKSCVTECKGDLFDAEDTLCLAHCVGADFRMGSGIAILFRQKFGAYDELMNQRVAQGGVAHIRHDKRYIFYLVTKRESTGKPTMGTLEKSLHALHKKCQELGVTELGMPRIGCGLDRLEWSAVKKLLEDIFADGFTIRVYNLEKDYKETKKSMPKTTIKINASYLKDIQPQTGLLYIGTVETFISEEMKSLDEKYRFLHRLNNNVKPKLGTVVRTEASSYPQEVVYGLICKQSPNDLVDFVQLRTALRELRKINGRDLYGYFGIQAFKERNDDNIMGKIETMLRYSYIEAEAWICFPPSLVPLMPQSSLPTYNSNTFNSGRTSSSEADNHRMAHRLREMQLTQEAMHRKLNMLDDISQQVLGPDGFKAKANEITDQLIEFGRVMQQLSSTTDNLMKEVHSFFEAHKHLPEKVTSLEKRVQVIEQRLASPSFVGQSGVSISNGTYSRSSVPDGPPPLLHNVAERQVCPSPGHYYERPIQYVHPAARDFQRYEHYGLMNYSFVPNNTIYATQQLPEENEALLRATRALVDRRGYKSVEKIHGSIIVQIDDHSKPWQILNYENLCELENLGL